MCEETPCTKGGCCYYTYFHIFYDIIFGGLFVLIEFLIARDWVFWDHSPSNLQTFITLDYIMVFLAFRFSQFLPKEFCYYSRGAVMIWSLFAGLIGIWGLYKYLEYNDIFRHVLGKFYSFIIIALIVLSFILLFYFIVMLFYWWFIEKPKTDQETQRLKTDKLSSDHYRRYDTEKKNKGSSSHLRHLDEETGDR